MTRAVPLVRVALVVALTSAPVVATADAPMPTGSAIVARPSGAALVIWDASSDIATIVTKKMPDARANALLEGDAARVLADALPKIDRSATSIAVRVIYQKTGAVSPVYGTATFAGVERYATLELSANDANGDRDRWRERGDGAPLPHWFAFDVIGSLPQR